MEGIEVCRISVFVGFCKSCGEEIYAGEYVYDLFPALRKKLCYTLIAFAIAWKAIKMRLWTTYLRTGAFWKMFLTEFLAKAAGGNFYDWSDEYEFE